MSGLGSGGAEPRPRPLSAGLWTLLSWLRRDDHSSTESVSSAGSDRTALSFAYLPPARCNRAPPVTRLATPPPPSDSYRRRARERSLRRQRDRDLTLHRKYGLYGFTFEANTLPASGRRDEEVRDRRAASECPRAHVPGKRRAPAPPAVTATASLPRRRARKRPAPPPPSPLSAPLSAHVAPMSRLPLPDERPRGREDVTGCKPEKYCKRDAHLKETKDVKLRSEKSFLKQIFENKKRNSAIDNASVRHLPNISELDKQAAELIEKYRLKEMPQSDVSERDIGQNDQIGPSKRQTEAWICTRCLKKYDSSVITCNYCLPLNKLNDSYRSSKVSNNCTQTKCTLNNTAPGTSSGNFEDKEKLKEMLKEMKDSLPKRPKSEIISVNKTQNTREMETKEDYPKTVEPATLRIGSKPTDQASTSTANIEQSASKGVSQNKNLANDNILVNINSVIITQPVVLKHTKENVVINEEKLTQQNIIRLLPTKKDTNESNPMRNSSNDNLNENEKQNPTNDPKPLDKLTKTKYDLNTPLKISSLLNPIYIPKTTSTANTQTQHMKQVDVKHINKDKPNTTVEPQANTEDIIRKLVVSNAQIKFPTPQANKDEKLVSETKDTPLTETVPQSNCIKPKNIEMKSNKLLVNVASPSEDGPTTSKAASVDQHARRRDLINQLERSIAKGDEKSAAEAAIKLAQLKLSCSVLSFSSQIVAETSPSVNVTLQQISVSKADNNAKMNESTKIKQSVQKSSQKNVLPVVAANKQTPEKVLKHNVDILDKNQQTKMIVENEQKLSQGERPSSSIIPKLEFANQENVQNTNHADKTNDSILPKLESANQTQSICVKKETVSKNPAPCEASTSKEVAPKKENDDVPILIWVEDKEACRGPVQLHVQRGATIGELRLQAERSLGLAARLQRWIVGRTLCTDERAPLHALAGPELAAPFYLCLVESDTKPVQNPQVEVNAKDDPGNVYNELVKLEKQALVPNAETFECGVCIEECRPGSGVVLRECVHSFCKECLSDVVRHSEEPVVACPAMGCRGFLQEREIRALVSPDDYEKWLARGLAAAESGSRNAFHCRTRDCTGWAMCDPGVRRFPCPVCKRTNCVPCQAIHEGETCEQHRAKLVDSATPGASQTDEGTRALLTSLISRGEALECPECSAIITKKWGCDWIKCSACKTEICWVTRGRRWGPAGRGDTTGGCRCGLDGKRCHPSCGYCH